MQRKLAQELANIAQARINCMASDNMQWEEKHEARIIELVTRYMPSGSGFDSGTKFDFERSSGERLVFETAFHHMNDAGMYSGWTEHTVTVRASLVSGFTLNVSGRNRNDIKDCIYQSFELALSTMIGD